KQLRRFFESGENVGAPSISPDESVIAFAANEISDKNSRYTLQLWDCASGKRKHAIADLPAPINCLAFTPDGRAVITGGVDARLHLWSVETGKAMPPLADQRNAILTVAFAPDETVVAFGKRDGTLVFWDVASRQATATIQAHPEWLRSIAFSPDGTTIVTGGNERELHVWEAKTRHKLRSLEVPQGPIFSLRFSADSALLAAGAGGGATELFDMKLGKSIASLAGEKALVRSVAFDQRGKLLASACGKTVTLHDISSRQDRLIQAPNNIQSMDVSPDGKFVAVGLVHTPSNGPQIPQVLVWNVANPVEPAVLQGHERWGLNTLAFSPDGSKIASAGGDGTVRIWDVLQALPVDAITVGPPAGTIYKVVYSPSGRHLATVNADGTVYILRL
ncbi:MAG: WD40 repeat domain-containing protein, partial [Deltaproteobacteria bacterium]